MNNLISNNTRTVYIQVSSVQASPFSSIMAVHFPFKILITVSEAV
jgi:hypothetical protein